MSNYRRWRVEGGWYFFTLVTCNRNPILTTDLGREALRGAMTEVRARMPCDFFALVLLPDHLHVVMSLPRGDADYSTRWRQIKSLFTRRYLRDSPLPLRTISRQRRNEHAAWQRRFYEHTLRDETDLKRCIDYIHVNPVKHGFVQRVRDWPWSSFHRFVALGEYDADWGSGDAWFGDAFQQWE